MDKSNLEIVCTYGNEDINDILLRSFMLYLARTFECSERSDV